MRSVSSIEKIFLEEIVTKFLLAKVSLEDIVAVTELSIERVTELQLEEDLLTQLILSETEKHQQEQDSSMEQLESLSVAPLDFDKAEDLSNWIDGRNNEEYQAELIIENLILEEAGSNVARNMIALKDKFSREDIARYTNLSIERVDEIYADELFSL